MQATEESDYASHWGKPSQEMAATRQVSDYGCALNQNTAWHVWGLRHRGRWWRLTKRDGRWASFLEWGESLKLGGPIRQPESLSTFLYLVDSGRRKDSKTQICDS